MKRGGKGARKGEALEGQGAGKVARKGREKGRERVSAGGTYAAALRFPALGAP